MVLGTDLDPIERLPIFTEGTATSDEATLYVGLISTDDGGLRGRI